MKKTARKKSPRRNGPLYAAAALAGLIISAVAAVGKGFAFGQKAYLNAHFAAGGFSLGGWILVAAGVLALIISLEPIVYFCYHREKSCAAKATKALSSYSAYRKAKGKRPLRPVFFLLAVGAGFLLLSALFEGLYYNMPL